MFKCIAQVKISVANFDPIIYMMIVNAKVIISHLTKRHTYDRN